MDPPSARRGRCLNVHAPGWLLESVRVGLTKVIRAAEYAGLNAGVLAAPPSINE